MFDVENRLTRTLSGVLGPDFDDGTCNKAALEELKRKYGDYSYYTHAS